MNGPAAVHSETPGAVWLMAAAMVLTGVGTMANQQDAATIMVTLAAVAVAAAVLDPSIRLLGGVSLSAVGLLLPIAIAVQAAVTPTRAVTQGPYTIGLVVLAALAVHAVVDGRWTRFEVPVIAAAYFGLMCWMIASAPLPDIDVYAFQQEGAAALLRGENPFAMTFSIEVPGPDPTYSPDVVTNGRLNFGFIYPPLSLLLALPGYLVAGDYRYGCAMALSVGVLLIARSGQGRLPVGAAMLLLFSPVTQQVVYWGWTDPFVILLLGATVYSMRHAPSLSPWAVGLLAASKQYMLLLLPLGAILLGSTRHAIRRWILIPTIVVALEVLPFLAWDAGSFVYSTLTMHLLQPFREDSYSIPALIARAGGPELPSAISVLAALGAMALVVWRGSRSVAGVIGGTGFVLLVFFVFAKQAFLHYYYLVSALLACAIALAHVNGAAGSSGPAYPDSATRRPT